MTTRLFPIWSKSLIALNRNRFREFLTGLASRSLGIMEPGERVVFLESEIRGAFGFRRVEILLRPEGPERFSTESVRVRDLLARALGIIDGMGKPFLNEEIGREAGVSAILSAMGATYAFPLHRGNTRQGLLVLDSSPRKRLGARTEENLIQVCAQVAVILENSSLLRGKLELQHALSEQAEMVKLGEMTARIAHEIKNPLSAIKTIIQIMQEDSALHPQYTRDLELINSEVDRLGNTVMQLLNFARPIQGDEGKVCLREASDSVLRFLERDLRQKGFQVENEIPADLPCIAGSVPAFREIFLNLILNSLQAGGEGAHLRLQAWESLLEDGSERFVLLVVEDDGPGIPPEIHERVFAPFFTTKQRGSGLGLAIVRRDVEHVGGHITLESPVREGRGTRFLIHLPCR